MKQVRSLFIYFCILIAASTTLLNCKKGSSNVDVTPTPPATDSILNKNVRIIDSTKLIINPDTSLLNRGHFEYTIVGSDPNISINDVIVGATNGGYIRKVSSIDKQQNKISFETTQGTMEDVFKNAGFNFTTNMDNLMMRPVGITGHHFPIDAQTLYQDGALSIALDKGAIDIDGNWNFGWKFKKATLDTFELSNKNALFNAQLTLNVTASQAITLAEHTSTIGRVAKYNVFIVYGIPIVVYTEVELRCIFSATIAAAIKRNIQINTANTANIAIKYKNSQWQNVFNNSSNSSITVGDKSGIINTEIKMAIVPYVSFRIMRVVGPYASMGLKELIKGSVASPSLDWDFYAGAWLQTIVGVRAGIFSKSWADYNKEWNTDTIHYETPYRIDKVSGDNQFGNAGQNLANSLKIKIVDNNNGSAQSNVPVYFTVSTGGGTVNPTSILTDANGFAETTWKLGQSGAQQVLIKSKKADGSLIVNAPIEFQATIGQSQISLTTTAVSSITSTSAISGGNITSDAGSAITDRGVCWSTSQTPTIVNSKTSEGAGTGGFTINITGLTANTPYFIRAYATNSLGTVYGNELSFITLGSSPIPDSTKLLVSKTWVLSNGPLKDSAIRNCRILEPQYEINSIKIVFTGVDNFGQYLYTETQEGNAIKIRGGQECNFSVDATPFKYNQKGHILHVKDRLIWSVSLELPIGIVPNGSQYYLPKSSLIQTAKIDFLSDKLLIIYPMLPTGFYSSHRYVFTAQ